MLVIIVLCTVQPCVDSAAPVHCGFGELKVVKNLEMFYSLDIRLLE